MFRKKEHNLIEIFDPNEDKLITSINCINERSRDEIFWAMMDSLGVYINNAIRIKIEKMVEEAKKKEKDSSNSQVKKRRRKTKPEPAKA